MWLKHTYRIIVCSKLWKWWRTERISWNFHINTLLMNKNTGRAGGGMVVRISLFYSYSVSWLETKLTYFQRLTVKGKQFYTICAQHYFYTRHAHIENYDYNRTGRISICYIFMFAVIQSYMCISSMVILEKILKYNWLIVMNTRCIHYT